MNEFLDMEFSIREIANPLCDLFEVFVCRWYEYFCLHKVGRHHGRTSVVQVHVYGVTQMFQRMSLS